MCTIINADYLLATVLSDRGSVSFRALNELRGSIESHCADLVVDVSARAIDSALQYYPEVFERQQGGIARAPKAAKYLMSDYRDNVFTSSVPAGVHERVSKVVKESCPS